MLTCDSTALVMTTTALLSLWRRSLRASMSDPTSPA